MIVEYITLGAYLCVLLVVGALFSKLNRNISDFARGGAQGTWWLVGTSMFMAGVSAFTFTGNASAAFSAGPTFLVIYFANCVGLALCIWIGPWFRQTRATTWADIMRERFNVGVEQVSAYFALLIQPVAAATQLYALAIFTGAILGIPTPWVIVGLGLVVLIYSTTGGRWAVMATDFVQGIILFALTLLMFFLALDKVGGFEAFFAYFKDPRFASDFQWVKEPGQFPGDQFTWKWIIIIFILQVQGFINLGTAGRFLSAKDSRHARWSAVWACLLMAIGSIIWFVPPMVARFLYSPEIMAMDIKEPATASYAFIAEALLPNGFMGLMLAAMLAATMSSMDTGLNNTTGVIVNNMIPRIRERLKLDPMTPKTELLLCRGFTVLLGLYIIVIGLLLSYQEELSLFEAYLMIAAVVGLPLGMPVLLALWVKRLHWAAYYIIIAFAIMPSAYFVIRSSFFGESSPIQDRMLWIYVFSAFGCILSLPLWKRGKQAYRDKVLAFYEKMHRPVNFEEEIGESNDRFQYLTIGGTALILGSLITLFVFMPNTPAARLQILSVGLSVAAIGCLLLWCARRIKARDISQ